jgi:hypothetical protein
MATTDVPTIKLVGLWMGRSCRKKCDRKEQEFKKELQAEDEIDGRYNGMCAF